VAIIFAVALVTVCFCGCIGYSLFRSTPTKRENPLPQFEFVKMENTTYSTFREFDQDRIIQNWNNTCPNLDIKNMADLYPASLHINQFARECDFNDTFFGKVHYEGAVYVQEAVRLGKLLYDLYFDYGIITSKRAGSLLGAYRSNGHLGNDSFTGDHFWFYPNMNTVSTECLQSILQMVAEKHDCVTDPIFLKKDDWNRNDIKCGEYESHGKVYEAKYLFLDQQKNEELARYNIYLHDAMKSLCFSDFNGIKTLMFDTPHIQMMLKSSYGDDFLTPQAKTWSTWFSEKFFGSQDLTNFKVPKWREKKDDQQNDVYTKRINV
jgi:hypothetical protein